ncbi:hypothetical protein BW723_02950 [Polaribacter reichenbachii]|uniref:Secretion system C-terminal sorting domain-containing protein n=1 Tax=Polaribacter reichenbachii TaxID=996801 RepID=A0A1B8TVB2_9FLAO|nr:T9SS type A sorting domain-containing protein [Polaribacter reichenbachii]APZ45320.1 hypothetical protein BW723_02950 [Polaribacter reichenbachii]AUC19182.1 hypothetical protein BTO17_10955 [Polaribacter reichenbachii]OBY63661.1 hypothetical protein LPB301_12750 [Polaribacter reichenbachii]
MKKNYFFALLMLTISLSGFGQSIIITSIIDGKAPSDGCSGSTGSSSPKAIELYVSGTINFAGHKFEAEANGSSSGESWSSEDISSLGTRTDEFVYIVVLGESTLYGMYSGATVTNTYVGGPSFNGNDAIRITDGTNVLDQFGDPSDVSGSSDHDNSWEYEDSFATRKSGSSSNSGSFDINNWVLPGRNYLDDKTSCAEMLAEINLGTYSTIASTTPTITVSGSTSSFDYFEGYGPSAEQSVIISGENLTDDINVTVPANFEVSLTSGSGFNSSATITQTGGVASATVYIRLAAGLSVNTYSGDAIASSTGAVNNSGTLTGIVSPADPQFSYTAYLDDFNYLISDGTTSEEQSFTVEGLFLLGDLKVTAPSNFEVSLTSGSGYDASVSLAHTSGTIAETTVYIRLKAGLSEGNYTGDITLTSITVDDKTIPVNGNVYGATSNSLVITGVYDGPLTGGTPKGVEIYVLKDIADLSVYGISSVTNGQGSTAGNVEFYFPDDAVTAGAFIYVSTEETKFKEFFGMNPTYTTGVMGINGDDAIELYENGQIIDVYGDVDNDFSGEAYDYLDGWAYRKSGTSLEGTTFTSANWTYSGVNGLEGGTNNATATKPFPLGTYNVTASVSKNQIEGFATYPNPITNNRFTITTNSTDKKQVAIFNVIGKQVLSTSFAATKSNIDVSSIASGLYILKVTEGTKTATSKLVIK